MNKSRGFTLIEVMIALSVLMVGSALAWGHFARVDQRLWAAGIGSELTSVTNAWRDRLSADPSFPNGTYTSWAVLRHTSCGGPGEFPGTAPDHFLPCNVDTSNTKLGRFFVSAVVTSTASSVPGVNVKIATIRTDPIRKAPGDAPSGFLAGLIASHANGFILNKASPVGATTFTGYDSDPVTARVIATTTSNPVADSWLRTDGSNFQNNHITFSLSSSGTPKSDLRNTKDVIAQRVLDWDNTTYRFDGDGTSIMNDIEFRGGDAQLTARSGHMVLSTTSYGTDIRLDARDDLFLYGSDAVNIDAQGSSANIRAATDVTLTAETDDITMSANDDIHVTAADALNLRANRTDALLYGRDDVNVSAGDAVSVSAGGSHVNVSARYDINASAQRNLNLRSGGSGAVTVDTLRIVESDSIGGGCSTGEVGRDSSGRLLQCVSSRWAKVGEASIRVSLTRAYGGSGTRSLSAHHWCTIAGTTQNSSGDKISSYVQPYGSVLADGRQYWRLRSYHEESSSYDYVQCFTLN